MCAAFSVFVILPGCDRGPAQKAARPPSIQSVSEEQNGKIDWPSTLIAHTEAQSVSLATLSSEAVQTPAPDLVVGAGTRGEKDEFGTAKGIAVDDFGRIYILDPFAYRVRVYAPDGVFIRDIGRKGHGPGEFNNPHGEVNPTANNGISFGHDTLYVLDHQIKAYDTAGVYLGSTGGDLDFTSSNSIRATSKGIVVVRKPSHDAITNQFDYEIVDFHRPDTLIHAFTVTQHFHEYGDALHAPNLPHSVLQYSIDARGFFYFVPADTFEIDVRASTGELVKRIIASPLAKIKITHTDVEEFIESNIKSLRGLLPGTTDDNFAREFEQPVRKMLKSRPIADYRESIGIIIASETGTILVSRPDITEHPYRLFQQNDLTDWMALDGNGSVLARVRLPTGFMPKVFKGCSVYGTNQDDDGTPLVLRFQLVMPRHPKC